jgi:predicted kinase
MQKLMLVRGLPGSGKSTYARTLKEEGYVHMEADMYFEDAEGTYHFNPKELQAAHKWCQDRTSALLYRGRSVVVSNTFTQHWEMQPYIDMAARYNISYEIITMSDNYGSIHGVPQETIERMKQRWEP